MALPAWPLRYGLRDRLAGGVLCCIAMRQRNLVAPANQALTQLDPVTQRPLFVGARGAVYECQRFF